jgi:SAM-dependent methyltransferase
MRRDFLTTLHCPYTGLPLSLSLVLDGDGEEINYGIVSTEATDFPIVEGILRLHVDEYRESIVHYVRAGNRLDALSLAFDLGSFSGRAVAVINFAGGVALRTGFKTAGEQLNRLKRRRTQVLTDKRATFAQIAAKLSSPNSYAHQMYRFTMPGFLSTFAFLHLVRPGAVLCFACGTGHEPFLISRMWPNTQIVCADYSFSALYISKRYFAPVATYVCLDGDYLLPFKSEQFSTIFSSDTLPILDSKLSLSQEFRRVGNEKAVTLLPHMHNRLLAPFAKSLTPFGYRQLFRDLAIRMMPDEQMVRDYFFNDTIDLTTEWSDEELVASGQHIAIIACKNSTGFVKSNDLWDQRIRSFRNPRINPIYRVTGRPGKWELTRCAKDEYVEPITQFGKICLPDTWKVTARSVDADGLLELQRTDPSQFEQLARSLVVLDLPERFI